MGGPNRIERNIQLLVEGKDQKNFFEAFAAHCLREDVQVQDFGGVNQLAGFLMAFVAMPGFGIVGSIGIVRDAETSALGAFQSVCSSLTNAGVPAPVRPETSSAGRPPVTVLILPGGGRAGMLETLLCDAVADAPERVCIDDYFACVRKVSGVPVKRPDKARAHAWLATRPDPHVSVGVAAQKGYWDLDHAAFASVRAFLAAL